MLSRKKTLAVGAILVTLAATPLLSQTKPQAAQLDSLITAAKDAAIYTRQLFTKAADQMSEEDYAFRPTPEVRTFGQVLAHVADANYEFCSLAKGEKQPVEDIEKTKTTRAEIRKALAESFDYCDGAYAGLTDATALKTVTFMGKSRPVLGLLFFRSQHSSHHYGNVATYMRLRGKVPPSTAARAE